MAGWCSSRQALDNEVPRRHSSLMIAVGYNQLLMRAEQAFRAGQLESARADLAMARRAGGDQSAVLHLSALVEKKSGNLAAARNDFVAALQLTPQDAQLRTNYANLLDQLGEKEAALGQYNQAIEADPQYLDARFNRAVLLQKLQRYGEALTEIEALLAIRPEARFHSARGAILGAMDRLNEAAKAFEESLALDPGRRVPMHGRARIALERGDEQAAKFYAEALAADPGNRDLLHGFAQALELEGRAAEGIAGLDTAIARDPSWVQGQILLARMRWEAGDGRAFTRSFEAAAEDQRSPVLWSALAQTYAGADLHEDAARAASRAAALAPDEPELRLAEAALVSEAGEIERADALFAGISERLPGRALHEARHALRCGRFDQAVTLLDAAREDDPWGVSGWAMTGLAWRLTGDERSIWLNDQPGFVSADDIGLEDEEIAAIAERLRSIHRTRAYPIGQSLRGGTQTRGRLFERQETEIQLLADHVRLAVAKYWHELPAPDERHPLLRHRSRATKVEGSWSVRLTDGGFHVAHFHPRGIVSSAAYFAIPETTEPHEGWLEIGGPPAELDLPLEPLFRIEPAPGRLALFPSYMFHGTRPFAKGERLTAAFDVVAQ